MGITIHSEPNDWEARWNNALEETENDMRPEPKGRPLQTMSSHTAPDQANESADKARRLGRVEYLLLTLIALGVAITIAMAVVDPSG